MEVKAGEFFEVPVGVYHTEAVGDEPLNLGFATKDVLLVLLVAIDNFVESVKSFFAKEK